LQGGAKRTRALKKDASSDAELMQKLFSACDSEADALNERLDDLNDGIMRLVSRHFSVLASARLARQVLRLNYCAIKASCRALNSA
jgi:hypothetical protein